MHTRLRRVEHQRAQHAQHVHADYHGRAGLAVPFSEYGDVRIHDGQVLDRRGVGPAGAASVSSDGLVVSAPVPGLALGSSYTVRWRVTSTDGHSPAGVYNFGVGVVPPPPTESAGASAANSATNSALSSGRRRNKATSATSNSTKKTGEKLSRIHI